MSGPRAAVRSTTRKEPAGQRGAMSTRRERSVRASVPSPVKAAKPRALVNVTVNRGPLSNVVAVALLCARVEASARAVVRKPYGTPSGLAAEKKTSALTGTGAVPTGFRGCLDGWTRGVQVRASYWSPSVR